MEVAELSSQESNMRKEEVKKVTSHYHVYSIFAKMFDWNIIIRKPSDKSKEGHSTKQNTSCILFKNTNVTKHHPGVSYIKGH